jgi:MSHA biogenesis protein MshJ
MKAVDTLMARLGPVAERINHLSLRERAMVFAAGVAVLGMAWQNLLMDPLTRRAHNAQQQLQGVRERLEAADLAVRTAAQSPEVMAAARNRALEERLAQLNAELSTAAHGYVAPERVANLLGELISRQQGLTLISLRNLPVQSLSLDAEAARAGSAAGANAAASANSGMGAHGAARDRGPFLHPVEVIVSGDYPSIVRYLQSLEQVPFRLHWERLELQVEHYPANRVRLVIGALSLSREWMSV